MNEDYVVLHKRSSQLVSGEPKLPEAANMLPGEIAVNYAKDKETISIKNSNNEIATFSSDNIINKVFRTISEALNDLNERIDDIPGGGGDVDKAYVDAQIATVNNAINVLGQAINDLRQTVIANEQATAQAFSALTQTVIDNEQVAAAAINQLKDRLDNLN